MTNLFDHEGFLLNATTWSEDIALCIAKQENIEMTQAQWDVVKLARQFYFEFDMSPNMRPLVGYVKQHLGPECGNSMYLMRHFNGSPAKLASKIAGLPKPSNCL